MEQLHEVFPQPLIQPTYESIACQVTQYIPMRQDFLYEFTSPSGETFCMNLYELAEQGYGIHNLSPGAVVPLLLPAPSL